MDNNSHIILYYKGDISALTLFCQRPDGHICFPPLPKLSETLTEDAFRSETVALRPTKLIKMVNKQLRLDDDLLEAEPGFNEQVDTPHGVVTVYMARFKLLDPPHQLMAERDCKLQPLTALIGRMPAEIELLRRAYTLVMES